MGFYRGPNVVTNGLVLSLDAGNAKSFTSGSTTWYDKSGYGNNGTLTNGPTFSSGSIVFDGVNDYVLLSRPVQDDFTLSCWINTNQAGSVQTQWYNSFGLIDCEVAGVANDFGLSMSGGRVLFGIGNTDTTIYSPLTYNDSKWHHIVCTRIKSTGAITLYIDTTSVATGTGQTGSLTSPSDMRIGSLRTNTNFFNGKISNTAIYNRALSAQEVLQNYTATKSRYNL